MPPCASAACFLTFAMSSSSVSPRTVTPHWQTIFFFTVSTFVASVGVVYCTRGPLAAVWEKLGDARLSDRSAGRRARRLLAGRRTARRPPGASALRLPGLAPRPAAHARRAGRAALGRGAASVLGHGAQRGGEQPAARAGAARPRPSGRRGRIRLLPTRTARRVGGRRGGTARRRRSTGLPARRQAGRGARLP